MMEYDRKKMGKILRDARVSAGLTQAEVALRLGYASGQFISNIERGLCTTPLDLLAKLIRAYKMQPEQAIEILNDGFRRTISKSFR